MITPYKILDHPSELRLRIYGKTIEELFSNAALAMSDILKHNAKLPARKASLSDAGGRNNYANDANKKVEIIKIESIDINSLLVDFLSEVLARSQINKSVYHVVSIKYYAGKETARLAAEIVGYPVTRFDEDIKAVTYENLDIKQINNIWQTDLVLDI